MKDWDAAAKLSHPRPRSRAEEIPISKTQFPMNDQFSNPNGVELELG